MGKRGQTYIALTYCNIQRASGSMDTKQLTASCATAHCFKHKEKHKEQINNKTPRHIYNFHLIN